MDSSVKTRSLWDFVAPLPWSSNSKDIVFIRDLDGPLSVTNDAENVWQVIQSSWPGRRVVYQGTDGQWFEMYYGKTWIGDVIQFKPWHGEVWDRLSKVES